MGMRIAITAAAVRTALGEDANEIRGRLDAGESALGPIVGFDASGFDGAQAAQIWREPETAEDDPALRILGPHGRLLDAVTIEAHGAAGLEALPRERVGLFVAMGMVDAPVDDLATAALTARDGGDAMSLRSFFAGAYRQIHPLWPLSMLNNVAAGQIAIDLDIRGDNVVLASDAVAGLRALLEAARSIDEGRCDAALAAGVSGRVSPAALARQALHGSGHPGEGGATLVFESETAAHARGAPILGYVLGGATTFGGTPERATAAARHDAGLEAGAELERAARGARLLGDLGAGTAASRLALTLAGWSRGSEGALPRRALLSATGDDGGHGALIVEEAV